jgi:hypothetical protein
MQTMMIPALRANEKGSRSCLPRKLKKAAEAAFSIGPAPDYFLVP